ncbi:MAG: exo-alpha-sialidase [Eubacteriales bacterium]|nr:exo-alpha-sialidase [Eubacteriales bacterium]
MIRKITRKVENVECLLEVESYVIFNSDSNDYKYSHHPFIAYHNGSFFAMWSVGLKDEDSPGQSVMYSKSKDAIEWSEPQILASYDQISPQCILTAGGFYEYDGNLLAYIGSYEYKGTELQIPSPHKNTMLYYCCYENGNWVNLTQTGLKIVPNYPPLEVSKRLIISGNISFPYTFDLSGRSGWTWTTLPSIKITEDFYDDSFMITTVRCNNDDTSICEGSIYESYDKKINVLLRSNKHVLYSSTSSDYGETWSEVIETNISDCNSKFHTGKLPNNKIYLIHNPLRQGIKADRGILSILTSNDGYVFDHEYVISDELIPLKYPGSFKGGTYGYPHSIIVDDKMYVICSINKEDVKLFVFEVNRI